MFSIQRVAIVIILLFAQDPPVYNNVPSNVNLKRKTVRNYFLFKYVKLKTVSTSSRRETIWRSFF